MKISVIIQPTGRQVVLTPEDDSEKAMLRVFRDEQEFRVYRRGYEIDRCRGGYMRQFHSEDSVILSHWDDK